MKFTKYWYSIAFFVFMLISLNLYAQDYSRWNLPEGAKLRIGKGELNDVRFTPDGKRVAVATDIGIWIYDANTRKELALLTGHAQRVTVIDFPADGRFLASGSLDGTVRLWNIDTGEQTAIFEGHRGGIEGIAVSPDGKTIVSGGDWGASIILWDVETGVQLNRRSKYYDNLFRRLKIYFDSSTVPSPNAIEAMDFSPDGKTYASGHRDGLIRVWNAENGRKLSVIGTHNREGVESLVYSPDGTTIASCTTATQIMLHTFTKRKPKSRHLPYVPFPNNLVFSPDGNHLYGSGYLHKNTFGRQTYIHKWNVNTGALIKSKPILHKYMVTGLAVSPDGKTLLSVNWGDTIVSWDTESLKHSTFTTGHGTVGRTLQFSPDGKIINTISGKDKLKFLDVETGAEIPKPKPKKYSTNSKSPTSQRTISAEHIKKWKVLRVFDMETGADLFDITKHNEIIWGYNFSPDKKILATTSMDMTIRLWEVSTGEELLMIPTFSRWCKAITFTPDGKMLVAGGVYDRNMKNSSQIRIWELPSGEEFKTLAGHTEGVESLRFSPDGKTLASCSGDGTFLIWDWEQISQSTK